MSRFDDIFRCGISKKNQKMTKFQKKNCVVMNYILMHLSHIPNLLSIYLKIFLILFFILKIVIDCNEL